MSRLLAAQRALTVPGWVKEDLSRKAQAIPSLDLRFAENKSLVDATTGANLVTFTRASSGTYVGSDGVLKTATTNEPRFDHNPTTGESLGLLVEEQRTNSIRNNTMVGAVAGTPGTLPTNWVIGGGGQGTLSRTTTVGESGGIAWTDFRFFGTTSTLGFILAFEPATQIAALTGQTWTSSFYVALAGGSLTNITQLRHDIVERTSAGGSVLQNFSGDFKSTLTSSLARSTYTVTLSGGATTAFVQPSIEFNFASGVAIDITLRIGLPQLEQGAFVTSVIPTTGTAATRNADVASITGTNFSSWYRQDTGTFFADATLPYTVPGTQFPFLSSANDGTTANRVDIGYLTPNVVGLEVTTGGVAQASIYPNISSAISSRRVAGTYALNDFAVAANTTSVGTDTSGIVPTVTQLRIGDRTGSATNYSNGTIRRLVYWGQRLPNNVLQTITQ